MEAAEFKRRMALGEGERRLVLTELYPFVVRRARLVCRRGGLFRPEDADEVVQDTCIALLTRWPGFRAESSLETWIWSIMANMVAGHHRFNGRWGRADAPRAEDGDEHSPNPAQAVPDNATEHLCLGQVMQALEGEPPARAGAVRTIALIEFVAEAGPDTAALAQFLNCTESAAKERKRYALQKLRELCEHFCGHADCSVGAGR